MKRRNSFLLVLRSELLRRVAVVFLAVLAFSAVSSCTAIMSSALKLPPKENRVVVEKDQMVAMRDGVHLATDVYKPRPAGKYPVILCRLPYGKNLLGELGRLFAQRGYVFVIQDCRATFNSEGEVFIPFVYDDQDGRDTVKWISGQDWSNGSLGLWGASYFGYTQWQVADDNPSIKAFYPQITTPNMYQAIFTGGAFHYSLATGWSKGVGKQNKANALSMLSSTKVKFKPDEGIFNMPLKPDFKYSFEELGKMSNEQLAVAMGLAPADAPNQPYPDAVEKMVSLFAYPGFAIHSPIFNYFNRYDRVKAPALLIAGWYDIFLQPQLDDFAAVKKTALEPGRSGTRIIVGPWGHASLGWKDAGKDARTMTLFRDMFDLEWFDYWMRGKPNDAAQLPPVKIYVMGKNQWRDENEWPLARTNYTDYFIHSQGKANSRAGDGVITAESPAKFETTDEFTYDPMNPVETIGGNNLMIDSGALDQKKAELRQDVLVYTSAAMTRELEITGPVKIILYAASSAIDTDFTAKLCVVRKDGTSLNLADGIARARYHDGYDRPELIKPGEVIKYEIDLWSTSYAFQPGEKIRIQVSSSNFPRYDRNSNCGGQGGKICVKKAYQTVYHDAKHPSKIVLPVIPED